MDAEERKGNRTDRVGGLQNLASKNPLTVSKAILMKLRENDDIEVLMCMTCFHFFFKALPW